MYCAGLWEPGAASRSEVVSECSSEAASFLPAVRRAETTDRLTGAGTRGLSTWIPGYQTTGSEMLFFSIFVLLGGVNKHFHGTKKNLIPVNLVYG